MWLVKYAIGAGFISAFFEALSGGERNRGSAMSEEADSKKGDMNVALVFGETGF